MSIPNLTCLINIACVTGDISWIPSLLTTVARLLPILTGILILRPLVMIILPKQNRIKGKSAIFLVQTWLRRKHGTIRQIRPEPLKGGLTPWLGRRQTASYSNRKEQAEGGRCRCEPQPASNHKPHYPPIPQKHLYCKRFIDSWLRRRKNLCNGLVQRIQ